MEYTNEIEIEEINGVVFSLIPVEHLVIDTIDRLGDYLLVYVPFLQFDDYLTEVELDTYERKLLDILLSKREFLEKLHGLEYCTLFIRLKSEDKKVEQIVFDVERACDFLAISQYRYDKKEWTMGKPGAIGPYLIMFDIDITTGKIDIVYKEKHFFNEIPGIGLEVGYYPLSRNEDFYPIIFMNRNDEVYMTCRYYITKACRTFAIPSLQSTFSELFATLEGIGMIGCPQFANFTKENKRLMSVICDNQSEYETNLDTFCFYSEVLRTLVLHQGHSLLEFMDRKSAFRLLTDIFWKIIIFAKNLIDTGICDLNSINAYIEGKIGTFSDHNSTVSTSFLLTNEEKGTDGDRDIFAFPIADLLLTDYIKLGKLLIIPAGFLNECRQDRNKCVGLEEYFIDRILSDNMIRQNNEMAFVLLKGEYQMNQFDTTLDSWQYIDDICGEIQHMLVPLFIQEDAIKNRNDCFGAVGVYNGIRGGFIYDSAYDEIIPICGRIYSLINSTERPFILECGDIDTQIVDIVCSGERNDEVAARCKSVLITLGKAMREDDITYMIMDMFDAVDKIYPCEYNIAPKWKWIASFVMDKRSEYDKYHDRLKLIGNSYRTPMYHYGKNVNDLFSKEEDIYLLFNEMKGYLMKCVKKIYNTGITSWDVLKIYRNGIMNP